MHRLLIVYEMECIAIYSVNKHEFIQHLERKPVLRAQWIPPKSDKFAVLLATGFLHVYKAESKSQQPIH
jgi:hypothetical protein